MALEATDAVRNECYHEWITVSDDAGARRPQTTLLKTDQACPSHQNSIELYCDSDSDISSEVWGTQGVYGLDGTFGLLTRCVVGNEKILSCGEEFENEAWQEEHASTTNESDSSVETGVHIFVNPERDSTPS